MDYEEAVDQAPPGWSQFAIEDVDRLPPAVRRHELARVPEPERRLVARQDSSATERLLRALFWTFVYHLEPERWDTLASFEPVHPDILAAMPNGARRAVDVGAGSGRLTQHLAERSRQVIAVEPSHGLRRLLAGRMPGVLSLSGWAERLPLADGCSDLTAACGAVGPDPLVLQELRRVTAHGGTIALVSPERPDWFEANGWRRTSAPAVAAPPHPAWIDAFFGPPSPPHEMVTIRIT
jgi:SAM-dependent methyltransferase